MDSRTAAEVRHDRALLAEVTLRKHRAERKLMHVMLTEAGVPEDIGNDGVRSCLTARVAWLISRWDLDGQTP